MKRQLLILVIAGLIQPLTFGQAPAPKPDPDAKTKEEVLRVDRERSDAIIRSDIPALQRILADDFTMIREDGATIKKVDRINEIQTRKFKLESIMMDDVKVRVLGDVVVVTALDLQRKEGQAGVDPARSTRIYVRRDGRWQLVASQQTRPR